MASFATKESWEAHVRATAMPGRLSALDLTAATAAMYSGFSSFEDAQGRVCAWRYTHATNNAGVEYTKHSPRNFRITTAVARRCVFELQSSPFFLFDSTDELRRALPLNEFQRVCELCDAHGVKDAFQAR